jgi:hypothetical protein
MLSKYNQQHLHVAGDLEAALADLAVGLRRAEAKFPRWPNDPIHGAAIVVEGALKAVKAAQDRVYSQAAVGAAQVLRGAYRQELVRCGATCLRAILDLDEEARDEG